MYDITKTNKQYSKYERGFHERQHDEYRVII